MIRLLSWLSRTGLAAAVFLIALAASRWAPVHAEPPLDVHALPLAGPALLLAIVAALTGGERRPRPVRPVLLALAVAAAGLGLAVAARGPAGLPLEAIDTDGVRHALGPGPVDMSGRDLGGQITARTLVWKGVLRTPEAGAYRLWVDGKGRAEVSLAGRPLLVAEGEGFHASADIVLGRGEQPLDVRLERVGQGLRLRLGWTRPWARGAPGGRDELIPPRYLGPRTSPALWTLTDLLAVVVALLAAALVLRLPWERPRRPPAPRPFTAGEAVASLAAYAALLAVMSWPLVRDPAGTGVVDRTDGRLNAWILAWDAHAFLHEPARLFQAPAFHPLPDALAFSENLLLPAALAAPAQLVGGPVLAYNFVLLASMALSGLAVQLLVRRASGDRLAAFVAGAFFAAGGHRWVRLAHLQAQVTVFLPLALLALDRFWERRTLRRALGVGLLLALQGLSSIYLGAVTAVALGTAVAVGLLGGLRPRELLSLGGGFLLAGLLLAPAVRPYLRMRAFEGMEFSLETVGNFATTLESYLAGGTRAWGGLTYRNLDPARVQDTLFPGLVPLALGLAGLAAAPPRYRAVALAASALAVILSLGPQTALYRFLHEHVLLLRGVRALSRFSLVPVLALAVLSGLALAGRRWTVSLGALFLMMLESSNVPLRYGARAGPPPAARWLAGRPGAVAYLPVGRYDADVMLDGVAHFRPLVNGYSAFVPRPYGRTIELLGGPLGEEGLRYLRAVDVRHLVAREALALPLAADFGDERVYSIPPGPEARPVEPGRPQATLWTGGGAVVDLGRPAPVGRVVFEVGEEPWVERPKVEVSDDGARWEEVEARASLADATLGLTRDPVGGRGAAVFAPRSVRYLRLDRRLPARPGALEVGP